MGVLPQGIQNSRGIWETVNTHTGQVSEFLKHTLPFFKINGATMYILHYECTLSQLGQCLLVLDSEELKEKSCRGAHDAICHWCAISPLQCWVKERQEHNATPQDICTNPTLGILKKLARQRETESAALCFLLIFLSCSHLAQ